MADENTNTGAAAAAGAETDPVKLAAEVEKWKALSRKNEDQAKANAAAATELAALKDAGKSEADKAIDRVTKAEAEVAAIPGKIAESLRDSLVKLGVVTEEDKVLLTASDTETLLAQVARLTARSGGKKDEDTNGGNRAPLQGHTADKGKADPLTVLTGNLFPKRN